MVTRLSGGNRDVLESIIIAPITILWINETNSEHVKPDNLDISEGHSGVADGTMVGHETDHKAGKSNLTGRRRNQPPFEDILEELQQNWPRPLKPGRRPGPRPRPGSGPRPVPASWLKHNYEPLSGSKGGFDSGHGLNNYGSFELLSEIKNRLNGRLKRRILWPIFPFPFDK